MTMKNSFGTHLTITLFGESRGEAVGVVLDGFPAGLKIDFSDIAAALDLRRPHGEISTSRVEKDVFSFVSGVSGGYSTGAPICILIPNTKAEPTSDRRGEIPRPGHADYAATQKYHGYADLSGGGHFSGRLTAPLCAAGALANLLLREKGVLVGTHIAKIYKTEDRAFSMDPADEIKQLSAMPFPVLDAKAGEAMKACILSAKEEGDSVGGVLETAVTGLPAGVGEPWFDTLEGMLAHAIFSIPAVKGVEFGRGFALSELYGSQANDALFVKNGEVKTKTNNAGGINGGISNGMPLLFRVAVKPTPSISKPQQTVDLSEMESTEISIGGKNDPCIVHRAAHVVNAMTALTLVDLMLGAGFLKR